jgi:hypothetical protein
VCLQHTTGENKTGQSTEKRKEKGRVSIRPVHEALADSLVQKKGGDVAKRKSEKQEKTAQHNTTHNTDRQGYATQKNTQIDERTRRQRYESQTHRRTQRRGRDKRKHAWI